MTRVVRWLLVAGLFIALAGAQALPRFTVGSVKARPPNERAPSSWQRDSGYWAVRNFPLTGLIADAFMINPQNFVGVPAWARTADYDIQARVPAGASDAQFRLMLQAMLADRFQLKAHQEMRPMDAVLLTAGPPGPNRRPASPNCVPPPAHAGGAFGLVKSPPGKQEFAGCAVTMAEVAQYFTLMAIHPVADATGLTGRYDLDVVIDLPQFSKGEEQNEFLRETLLAVKQAFQQQLGLNLDFTQLVKRPMPVLVIDHIAQPTAN